jgi:peptidoglycan hydrolase-like protein with peptidoglycan-binding domain
MTARRTRAASLLLMAAALTSVAPTTGAVAATTPVAARHVAPAPVSGLLGTGSRGPAVAAWQGDLNGFLPRGHRVTVDAIFGPATRLATQRLQRRVGVRTDGIVGPATRRALAAARRPRPVIILEGDGLGFLTGRSSIRQVPFGANAATARQAVTTALGPLTVTALPDCGQGPRTSAARAGFSLLLDGRRFVGWTDQGAPGRRLTTADGLGIGSTLAQLRRSLGTVTVTRGTLGPEWTSGRGLSGLLDGTRPTSRVTVIDSGETCFFR